MLCLLKKEIKEVIYDYKSWLAVLISIVLPYLLSYTGKEEATCFYISIVLSCISQYIYNSFLSDTKTRGIIFVYNLESKTVKIFIAKVFVAIVLLVIIFIFNITYILEYVPLINIIWIVFFLITTIAIMYFTAMFSQSSETTSTVITLSIVFGITFFLWNLDLIILKIGISLVSAILMSFIAIKTADSLIYRQQL
ncbi:MAG: hypothetical protein E7064_06740 [Spirochaetaceae bacterium]|nr:hypothetical protein [Spirochaetaceae bacterium]